MDAKTLLLWLLTISFWGVTPIIEKAGLQNVAPLAGLLIRTISALLGISLVFFLFSPHPLKGVTIREVLILCLSGITGGFLGMLFYFKLLKFGQASVVVPLTSTYPLVTTLFALLILREPLNLSKIGGTLLIISGIYLLLRES